MSKAAFESNQPIEPASALGDTAFFANRKGRSRSIQSAASKFPHLDIC